MRDGNDRAQPASVWDAVSQKRVIREFSDRPIAADELVRILNAGRRAASSKNLQRWQFIVCREREHLRELSQVGPWAGHLAGAAVAVALVTPDPTSADAPLSVMFDLGMAAGNMMLVAWELGIGSVPATVYEQDLARRLLGYPADHHCEYVLSFGYPADPADLTRPNKAGGRVALADIVHDERW
ncbi:MAG TPA: nitroreductase family protein [Candidatus Limnocylindrales bacterium]|nr:nitroreductase family protein [Candidatus Limnocylindrales bacterium]